MMQKYHIEPGSGLTKERGFLGAANSQE
jgi:hypothetical protein